MSDGQLDHLSVRPAEARRSRGHEFPQLRRLDGRRRVDGLRGHVARLFQRGAAATAAQDAQTLVPGDRVQPRPEALRVAQLPDPFAGDHERVVDRVRRRIGIAKHRHAVRVEPVGVSPVRPVQAAGVTVHHRRHQHPVLHGRNVYIPTRKCHEATEI